MNLTDPNQKQQAGLDKATAAVNATRSSQDPPLAALTSLEYLDARVQDVLNSYASQIDDEDLKSINNKWAVLSDKERQDIKAIVDKP